MDNLVLSSAKRGLNFALRKPVNPRQMNFSATLLYNGSKAYYLITMLDKRGIFEAELSHYEGLSQSPPNTVLLIKGVGHWCGSIKDPELTYDLGCAIDKELYSSEYRWTKNTHQNS